MPKRSRKLSDPNVLAAAIVQEATKPEGSREKNPAAVALGRLGGLKGGKERAKRMTPAQRSSSARKAATARWTKRGRNHD